MKRLLVLTLVAVWFAAGTGMAREIRSDDGPRKRKSTAEDHFLATIKRLEVFEARMSKLHDELRKDNLVLRKVVKERHDDLKRQVHDCFRKQHELAERFEKRQAEQASANHKLHEMAQHLTRLRRRLNEQREQGDRDEAEATRREMLEVQKHIQAHSTEARAVLTFLGVGEPETVPRSHREARQLREATRHLQAAAEQIEGTGLGEWADQLRHQAAVVEREADRRARPVEPRQAIGELQEEIRRLRREVLQLNRRVGELTEQAENDD